MIGWLIKTFTGGSLLPWLLAGCLAVSSGAYLKGRADANANCQADELRRELLEIRQDKQRLEQQAKRAREALAETNRQAALDRKAQSEAEERARAFEALVMSRQPTFTSQQSDGEPDEGRTADPCGISPDDARRLRDIR